DGRDNWFQKEIRLAGGPDSYLIDAAKTRLARNDSTLGQAARRLQTVLVNAGRLEGEMAAKRHLSTSPEGSQLLFPDTPNGKCPRFLKAMTVEKPRAFTKVVQPCHGWIAF